MKNGRRWKQKALLGSWCQVLGQVKDNIGGAARKGTTDGLDILTNERDVGVRWREMWHPELVQVSAWLTGKLMMSAFLDSKSC